MGGVGLGGRLVEFRSDRRAAAAKKNLSAVLESLRQRMHPQVSRKDTRHSGHRAWVQGGVEELEALDDEDRVLGMLPREPFTLI